MVIWEAVWRKRFQSVSVSHSAPSDSAASSGQQAYRAAAPCRISAITASGESGCSSPLVDGIVQPHDLRRGRVGGAAGLFMVLELTDDPVYRRIHVHDRGIPAAFASQIQLAAVLPAAAQPGHLPAAGAAEVWSQPRNGRLLSVGLLPGILFPPSFPAPLGKYPLPPVWGIPPYRCNGDFPKRRFTLCLFQSGTSRQYGIPCRFKASEMA